MIDRRDLAFLIVSALILLAHPIGRLNNRIEAWRKERRERK